MKNYQKPKINMVFVDDNDLICTSNNIPEGQIIGNTTGEQSGARQRNPIWDDYE